jgi:phage head maturation protease
MSKKLTYVSLAPILKYEPSADGTSLKVFGKATDETLDGDKQIVDLNWASKALEEWLSTGGNVRVQHNPSLYPAGVGIEVNNKNDGSWLTSEVVEPTAMKLVERGALRAYSIGIANPKIKRDVGAPNGRIVGGEIVEVSLVDRPANPSCGIKLVKAADGFAWDLIGKADQSNGKNDDEDDNSTDAEGDDNSPGSDNGDTDSDSPDNDSDGDGDGDDGGDSKKADKVDGKLSGSALEQSGSDRRSKSKRSQSGDEVGHQEGERQGSQGKADQRAVETGGNASDASPHLKIDLTGDTQPTVVEVGKFDSTDPKSVVGAPTYPGQAVGTTPMDTNLEGEAEARAESRARTQGASLPVTTSTFPSQQPVPELITAASTKGMSGERYEWFVGKSDVSTKPKREGAKFSLRGPDGEVKYPINDCSDVSDAWKLRSHSDIPEARVAAYVRRAAKKLGCSVPGDTGKYLKAQKQIKKLRKQNKKLRKQLRGEDVSPQPTDDERTTLQKWADIVEKSKAQDAEIQKLTAKLEKISSQPTLGKAIRAPRQAGPVTVAESDAEAQKRAADQAAQEYEQFLENLVSHGSAIQQSVALDLLAKHRAGISKST